MDDYLPVAAEIGTFTETGLDTITCSVAGPFFSAPLSGTFTPPPPVITGVVDNTTGSNTIYVGQSNYLQIHGSALTAWAETPAPTITGDDSAIPLSLYWASDNQVNVTYTVGTGARTGQHSLWVTTEAGKSNAGTYLVYDPTPVITSITPSTWQAGTSTPVTISGSGFGTAPSVSVSDSNVLFAAGSVSNTSITGTVTVNAADPGGTPTVTVTSNGFGSGFQGASGQAKSAAVSVSVTPTPPAVSITRTSLTQFNASGSPPGGTFSYSSQAFAAVSFASGVTSATNPNTALMSNMGNPDPKGKPTSGALALVTGTYSRPPASPGTSTFHAASFGLSCYYTTTQQEWGLAPGSCSQVTISGTVYSGYAVNPPGLPQGSYCNAFLAELRLQGSAALTSGTLVQYDPATGYHVVSQITGADGSAVQSGRTIARDRNIIPKGGVTVDVNDVANGLLANDTGSAIIGYRIDYYKGLGASACSGFSNVMAIAGCNPGNKTCPADTAVQ